MKIEMMSYMVSDSYTRLNLYTHTRSQYILIHLFVDHLNSHSSFEEMAVLFGPKSCNSHLSFEDVVVLFVACGPTDKTVGNN